jgi:hypothetical protein
MQFRISSEAIVFKKKYSNQSTARSVSHQEFFRTKNYFLALDTVGHCLGDLVRLSTICVIPLVVRNTNYWKNRTAMRMRTPCQRKE